MTTQHRLLPINRSNTEIGMRFGRLTVRAIGKLPGSRKAIALCDCDCGKTGHPTRLDALLSGATEGCGCVQRERSTRHGAWNHRQFSRWSNMMRRCYEPTNKRWKEYGGRGIRVCKRWHDPNAFISDMDPGYSEGMELDRVDVSRDYAPTNCRWVTHAEQARNKHTTSRIVINGVAKTAAEWSRVYGIHKGTVWERIKLLGWDPVRAVTTPARPFRR